MTTVLPSEDMGDRITLVLRPRDSQTYELRLLGPYAGGSGEDPDSSGFVVIARVANDCRIPVGGNRNTTAGTRFRDRIVGDQFGSLLAPDAGCPCEYPCACRPRGTVTYAASDGCVPVTRECYARTLHVAPNRPVPTSLAPCWTNCALTGRQIARRSAEEKDKVTAW
jgi:hypothetical protein